MKTKNRIYLLFIVVIIFINVNSVLADSDEKIRINEVLPNPSGEEKEEEFIEIYNYGSDDVDLAGWKIEDKGGSETDIDLTGLVIKQGEYLIFYSKDHKISLANSGDDLVLKNIEGEVVSGKSGENFYKSAPDGKSWSWDGNEYVWTEFLTPESENKFNEDDIVDNEENEEENGDEVSEDDKKDDVQGEKEDYSGLRLNEILPNPSGEEKDGEYIEIFNDSNRQIDLAGCVLRDASKTGKSVIADGEFVEPKSFWLVYRTDFKFSLNNTGSESVFLYSPDEKIIDEISYAGSVKEDESYNFSKNIWQWSAYLTPGKENKFAKKISIGKIKFEKKVYENISIQFSVKIKNPEKRDLKFVWEFGDGKKSYLENPTHKYLEKGTYRGKLIVNDDIEKVEKEFQIKVKKYPKYKVEFEALMPNPSGIDADDEWIELKNYYKKNLNLKGWSIVSGVSNETATNHPIYNDFIIKAGKSAKIYHKNSAFSLGNKQGYIELRYPSGEKAYAASYSKPSGVKENEIYFRVNRNHWIWIEQKTGEIETGDEVASDDQKEMGNNQKDFKPDENANKLMGGATKRSQKHYLALNFGLEKMDLPVFLDILEKNKRRGSEIKILKKPGFFSQLGEKLDNIFGLM